jgi:hypothetical protein
MNDAYNNLKNISTLVCCSGEIVQLKNVKRMSIKPFDTEDRTVSILQGNEDGRYIYIMIGDKQEVIDTHHPLNIDFMNPVGRSDKNLLFKSIIKTWIS